MSVSEAPAPAFPTLKPPKRVHTLTVLKRWQNERRISDLRLCGAWLRRFGFVPGRRVLVQCEPGRLTVTFEEPVAGDVDAGEAPLSPDAIARRRTNGLEYFPRRRRLRPFAGVSHHF
jgi:hypothetical protein